jgi:chromosome segregation ATPase
MEASQNKIDFPSPDLEDVVGKLWNKIHEISGTINFLIERNNELKEKLDSKGMVSHEDIAKMKEMERNIESLELENDEYLGEIARLKQKLDEFANENTSLKVFAKNYDAIVNSYNKLKNENSGKATIEILRSELEESKNKFAGYDEEIIKLNCSLEEKNVNLIKAAEEINLLKNLNEEKEKLITKTNDATTEIDKLNDMIDTLHASRDVLIKENDTLKLEIEKLKTTNKDEIEELKQKIRNFENERIKIRNEFRELNEILVAVEEDKKKLEWENTAANVEIENLSAETNDLKKQIDALNEQLSNADALIKSIEQKDRTIEQLTAELNENSSAKLILENQIGDAKAKYDLLEKDYFDAVKSIEELKDALVKRKNEEFEITSKELEILRNDLQVKEKMIIDFVANEKEMLNKLHYLENELKEKEKYLRDNIDTGKDYKDKLETLESLLVQKDKNIDELIKYNKSLTEKVASLEKISGGNAKVQKASENIKTGYKDEIDKISTERNRLEKELTAKSNSLIVMEIQVKNLQEKIRELELTQIRSDEGLSLDAAIREKLIYNLEKQLGKLENLIGK